MFSTASVVNAAAYSKSANLLAGDINEFVSQDSIVNIYAVASASGIKITALADSDVAIDDKEIMAIGTTLDKSQHLLDSFGVSAGTRLAITLRESANVATTDTLVGIEVLPV